MGATGCFCRHDDTPGGEVTGKKARPYPLTHICNFNYPESCCIHETEEERRFSSENCSSDEANAFLRFSQIKCDQYWPSRGTETYGMIQATLLDTMELATFCVRTFSLHKVNYFTPPVPPVCPSIHFSALTSLKFTDISTENSFDLLNLQFESRSN